MILGMIVQLHMQQHDVIMVKELVLHLKMNKLQML